MSLDMRSPPPFFLSRERNATSKKKKTPKNLLCVGDVLERALVVLRTLRKLECVWDGKKEAAIDWLWEERLWDTEMTKQLLFFFTSSTFECIVGAKFEKKKTVKKRSRRHFHIYVLIFTEFF